MESAIKGRNKIQCASAKSLFLNPHSNPSPSINLAWVYFPSLMVSLMVVPSRTLIFIHYPKWYAQILHLPLVTRKKFVLFSLDTHPIGSPQKSFRLHALQCLPIQTSSNWFMACSTSSGLSVRMPASKLRVPSPFMPMPAPVRLALPI